MSRPPVISGREAVRAFEKIGYRVDRQKGSHIQLRQDETPFRRLTVRITGRSAAGYCAP